jgi:diguanylate cyclase (GGDEF)-like protein
MNDSAMSISTADILIVDDTANNLRLLSEMLVQQGYSVRKAISGQMALTAVRTLPPDIILLDIMMPEMDGYQVCQHLKSEPSTAEIPVIFLSALNEAFDKVKAFQVGAGDYITKPFQFEEVLIRVKNQLMLRTAERRIRQLNVDLETRVQERTRQLEEVNAQLLNLALHDALTGLPNRVSLMERLTEALQRSSQDPNYQFAVLFLDCDRFKLVNDSLGHLVGDELLIAVSRAIATTLNPEDTLARLGGDEFAILLTHLSSDHEATTVAQNILDVLAHPFQLSCCEVFTSTSIGIVLGHSGYTQPEHILRDADTAMYRVKKSGKCRYQLFDPTMHTEALQRLHLETDLRRAIQQQEFILHYQPIVSLATQRIRGFEALIRWIHPKRGYIPPNQFIGIAEETGLICEIGQWVLREACRQLREWQQQLPDDKSLTMSVNLSARQLTQTDLIAQIDEILDDTQLAPKDLKLEITESAIMENAELAITLLKQLQKRHIQLSIDDFGTGYSSLSYLHQLPVQMLKIDGSFVSRVDIDGEKLELVRTIVNLAWNLGMEVTAEGVETSMQLAQLRALKCEFAQGYFFSKPLPAEAMLALLQTSVL